MGPNVGQGNMHDWKGMRQFRFRYDIAYIRGVHGEDLSTFIKSVTFTLHPSFRQNQRGILL